MLHIIDHYSEQLNLNTLKIEKKDFNFLLSTFQNKVNQQLDLEIKTFSSAEEKMNHFLK